MEHLDNGKYFLFDSSLEDDNCIKDHSSLDDRDTRCDEHLFLEEKKLPIKDREILPLYIIIGLYLIHHICVNGVGEKVQLLIFGLN